MNSGANRPYERFPNLSVMRRLRGKVPCFLVSVPHPSRPPASKMEADADQRHRHVP